MNLWRLFLFQTFGREPSADAAYDLERELADAARALLDLFTSGRS